MVEKDDLEAQTVILRPPSAYVELFDFGGYQGYPR